MMQEASYGFTLAMKQLNFFFLFIFLFPAFITAEAEMCPQLGVRSAVMIDFSTGTVICEKNPDMAIPPASLTKLMSIHIALKQIDSGVMSLNDVVAIPEHAYATNMPPRSSLMFLGPGQKVTVGELIKGMAVSSGNDAAVALACHVAGSVDDFVYLMNKEAERMGLSGCRFVDPAGLDENNTVTALEFARFCREYISLHPDSLDKFHSIERYTYPKKQNVLSGTSYNSITQYNRNILLSEYPDADGLKTGYIDESGYNLAATAHRNGMRLITVLLGGEGATSLEGVKSTAEDARRLFQYGFDHFETVSPKNFSLEPVVVWKGRTDRVAIKTKGPVVVTIRKKEKELLTLEKTVQKRLLAPVDRGEKVGILTVKAGDSIIKKIDLIAAESVEEAGFFGRTVDSVRLWLLAK